MAQYRQVRRLAGAALIGLVIVLATGCSLLKSKQTNQQIDPPPINANLGTNSSTDTSNTPNTATMADITGKQATTTKSAAGTTQVTLYFKDSNGFVAPISMAIPNAEQIAQQSLAYMVEGGPEQALLPPGFTALLPKGTQVKGINILKEKKLAVVDFSNAFSSYNAQDERKIMEAVVWTLTGFPSVDQVQFKLEGKVMTEMPVYNTPLAEPLSRKMGINLEIAPGINVGQATPVTLYFQNNTDGNFTYFVPVTRMIKRTDQPTTAVVDQLIQGPIAGKGLSAVVAADTKVLKVQLTEDHSLITVDLNSPTSTDGTKISANSLESMILSLTESTGAAQVQFTVNGEKKALADDTLNYAKPVTRPAHVNPLKL
jgi:germination protein M